MACPEGFEPATFWLSIIFFLVYSLRFVDDYNIAVFRPLINTLFTQKALQYVDKCNCL